MAASELDEFNERILKELRIRGTILPSGTWIDGSFAIRSCFINPRSGLDEAEALLEEVLEIGRAQSI